MPVPAHMVPRVSPLTPCFPMLTFHSVFLATLLFCPCPSFLSSPCYLFFIPLFSLLSFLFPTEHKSQPCMKSPPAGHYEIIPCGGGGNHRGEHPITTQHPPRFCVPLWNGTVFTLGSVLQTATEKCRGKIIKRKKLWKKGWLKIIIHRWSLFY